jgi:monoterpene epsilon-lactone hydrolase
VSRRRRILNVLLRHLERRQLARMGGPDEARRSFEWKARLLFRPPRGTRMRKLGLIPGVPALEVAPAAGAATGTLLYLHGGGYFFGSPRTHAGLAGQLAARCGARVILPDYRLAPEHPFPAALDDALAAWTALAAEGRPLALAGDSAGGGLALALLARICAEGLPQPALTVALSPWTDLTLAGPSIRTNEPTEVLLPPERLAEVVDRYLAGTDPAHPFASPLFAQFPGAGPVLILASTAEILLDDSRRMAAALASQKVPVDLILEPSLPHVWPFFARYLPEADRTLDLIGTRLRAALRPPASAGN